MMDVGIICFSKQGRELAEKIKRHLETEKNNNNIMLSCKSRYVKNSIEEDLSGWTKKRFEDSDALVFIGSCGIAVRAVAPFIKRKDEDPAVVVIDELGQNCVSLLSGHIGGANELTRDLSEALGAHPVITTATDINGMVAPDMLAKLNDCVIDDPERAKMISAAMVNDGTDEYPIVISPFIKDSDIGDRDMLLIPRITFVGIGCRSGIDEQTIGKVCYEAFENAGLDIRSVRSAASIDLKKEETGLLALCEDKGWNIRFYTAEELMNVPGTFSGSDFVAETTGADNVCERSAMAAAAGDPFYGPGDEEPQLCMKKYAKDGVTIAIAIRERRIRYE